MAKATDRKVGEIMHRESGMVCDIRLNGTQFIASILGRDFRAPDAKMLEADVLDYVQHWLHFDWHPVIEVEVDEGRYGMGGRKGFDPSRTSLQVEIDRFYLSRSPTGKIMYVGWDVDPETRKASARPYSSDSEIRLVGLPLPGPLTLGDEKTLLNYEEPLWQALESIIRNVHQLRLHLGKLTSTRQGVALLIEGAASKNYLALEDSK